VTIKQITELTSHCTCNNIRCRVKIIKLLITNFPPYSFSFLLYRSQCSAVCSSNECSLWQWGSLFRIATRTL